MYDKSGELASGASSLYNGTTLLAKGTQDLSNGSSDMKKGLSTLSNGASSLTSANNQLTDGASTLLDGANTLSDGMSKFNQDGIKKLCGYINGDLKDVSSRLEKLQELANEYDNFTMLSDGNQGTTKFIMVMDGIHKEDSSKETAVTNEDKRNDNEVLEEERD